VVDELWKISGMKRKNPALFMIGYEGADLARFIKVLQDYDIELIVDVRFTPISRKKGFSKTALAQALARQGILYVHIRELGCPKQIRMRYQRTGDFSSYVHAYRNRVLDSAASGVADLASRAERSRVCLLCFEKDHDSCHRSVVAEKVRETSQKRMRLVPLQVAS